MKIYFINGQYINKEDVSISIDDRGYYFGDGIYEVIKVYGGEPFTAQEHLNRLFESSTKIKLSMPYTKQQLFDVIKKLISANAIVDGHVYMQVTRGSSLRQHNFPEPSVAPIFSAYAVKTERPLSNIEQGVSAKSVEDIRWLLCDIKSLNLLGSVLAKEEAKEAGCYEAILHRNGVVTEGSSTNIFGVKDGIVRTHPATNLILNGITRQIVLQMCEELTIQSVENEFTLEEAFDMDELFLTSTTSEITPITRIDGKSIGDGKPGPTTRILQKAFNLKIPLLQP